MGNNEIQKMQFALGLAQKAGKIATGDFAVRDSFQNHKVRLLILATDAASHSKENMHRLAERSGVEVIENLTSAQIGSAIGKGKRICAAVLDANFTNLLQSKK